MTARHNGSLTTDGTSSPGDLGRTPNSEMYFTLPQHARIRTHSAAMRARRRDIEARLLVAGDIPGLIDIFFLITLCDCRFAAEFSVICTVRQG
jgi:hypothetical protein